MKTITFDTEKAKIVELAVCSEFGGSIYEIVRYTDTVTKKVVVFILNKIYGYDKRILGVKYQMTYLYVPTVLKEMEQMVKVVPGFENKINSILNKIANG